jgi:syntaxin 1B/2/3
MIHETNKIARKIKDNLTTIEEENKRFESEHPESSEARMRGNLHRTVSKKFMSLMTDYQEAQVKYKQKYRDKIERQYQIGQRLPPVLSRAVKPNATKEEIEQIVDGNPDQVFASAMMVSSPHAPPLTCAGAWFCGQERAA